MRLLLSIRPFLILALLCIGILQLFADGITLRDQGENKLEVKTNTTDQLVLFNSVSELGAIKVQTGSGIFVQLIIPGYSFTEVVGEPQLPVNRRLIEGLRCAKS